ncbi:Copper amine oxidase-like protein 4 [Elsinoe fawcettii]|nr:Copper amine oxidase-like protein 4 [Elsinoe fawcettii]
MARFQPAVFFTTGAMVALVYLLFITQPWTYKDTVILPVTHNGVNKTSFHAPHANVWHELSVKEADSIYTLLEFDPRIWDIPGLDRKKSNIQWLEALRPNKTDASAYLSHEANQPARWAKAMIGQSINGSTYLNYYSVGPLPVSSETGIQPLTWPYKHGRNGIKTAISSFNDLQTYATALASNISDITEALLDGSAVNDGRKDPNQLRLNARMTFVDEDRLILWCGAMRTGPHSSAWSILPQGLFIKIEVNPDLKHGYQVLKWYYNGLYYDTDDELRAAMKQPDFQKALPNYDGDWTHTEDLTENEERGDPPPVMIQPYGPRYKLDRKAQYVSYMGWTFYFTSFLSTGPALYDIRFRGTPVLYELTMNEAMAHYAGDDPIQGGQEFLDAAFGMGKFAFELVPGYDCPAYADFISTNYHLAQQTWTNKNSICLFEYTDSALLQRHTSQYQITVSRNTFLTLRYVATVGNYDYTFDYIFYLDGTLEVKVRASGFIFAAFYSNSTHPDHPPGKDADKYGYRIHDAASSSMHDHVILFRADTDIAGPNNSFSRLQILSAHRSYEWEQPEIPTRNTMVLHSEPVAHETGLTWPANAGEMYLIESAQLNAWGEKRAYRITPGTGMGTPPHLTVKNSTVLGRSAKWAEKDIWVLRHKDEERSGAEPLNWFAPQDPLVDFEEMVDGEDLGGAQGDDLVVYFNLGAHHIPHSGDVPNTLMHTSASSVMFVPHNFLDKDASRRTSQGVRMALRGGNGAGWVQKQHGGRYEVEEKGKDRGVEKLEYFGGRYHGGFQVGAEEVEPDLRRYDGKVEEADQRDHLWRYLRREYERLAWVLALVSAMIVFHIRQPCDACPYFGLVLVHFTMASKSNHLTSTTGRSQHTAAISLHDEKHSQLPEPQKQDQRTTMSASTALAIIAPSPPSPLEGDDEGPAPPTTPLAIDVYLSFIAQDLSILSKIKDIVTNRTTTIDGHISKIRKLQQRIQKKHAKRVQRLQNKKQRLGENMEKKERELRKMEREVQEKEDDMDALVRGHAALAKRVEELQERLDSDVDHEARLEAELEREKGEKEKLREEVDGLRRSVHFPK